MNKFLQTSLILTIVLSSSAEVLRNPTSYSSDIYKEIILNGNYDLSIDHPNKFLDFKYGERVASTIKLKMQLMLINNNQKIKVVQYGKTHEGRLFMHYLFLLQQFKKSR